MTSPEDARDRDSEPPSIPALPHDVRRGRTLFFVLALSYLAWELTVLVLQAVNESPLLTQSIVRILGGSLLFFFAWRGKQWAHVLLGIAFGIFFLAGWLTAIGNAYGPAVGGVIAVAGTWFGVGGAMLSFEPRLKAYFAHQRIHD